MAVSAQSTMALAPIIMRLPSSTSFDLSSQTSPSAKASQHTLRKEKSFDFSPSLTQIGALAWSKSASGGRLRHIIATKAKGTTAQKGQWSTFLGYIGANRPKPGPSLLTEAGSFHPEPHGQCFRLGKTTQTDEFDTTQRALLYLKLRSDGCSKRQSLVFTQKRRCRFDTTQTWDGPSCHRTIALGDNRVEGPNWSGWQLHSPKLHINRKFQPIVISDQTEDYDVVTGKFEAMSRRKANCLGTEDEHRNSYLTDLAKEWAKRQAKPQKWHKSDTLTLSIPEESTPVSLEESTSPAKLLETDTSATDTKPSVLLSHSKLPSFGSDLPTHSRPSLHIQPRPIYPVTTQHFPCASVTFRSIVPEGSQREQKVPRRRSEFKLKRPIIGHH